MTLVLAWIRKVGITEELCIASDSRVTSGKAWDCCPKIKPLDRKDSVLAFAGDTAYAYPMMEQASNAINFHPKLNTRALDITDLNGHISRVISNMREYLHDSIQPHKQFVPELPETQYLFAGYSWKYSKFMMWRLEYKKNKNAFIPMVCPTLMKNQLVVLVDTTQNKEFDGRKLNENLVRRRIFLKMVEKGKSPGDFFDMEPFEILRDIIRNDDDWAIGGTPQLIKVYKHLNHMPYGIFWPNKASHQITIMGRPILNYETFRNPVIDPDTFEKVYMKINNDSEFAITSDDGKFDKYREIKDL
ncbi:MAG: hypothetical protein REI96_13885 [Flavobacterium nitrogenifigens]|uniref:hypothetical protein n=1 Tax=Flavobacterium nitrogenifigens TaxID=1617283 RepID=UPI002808F98C|nr:hypothetical protein [Flavobacterium nitrogenifigens]MDQ8013536.1 hypothetical protein [Flavobacterium nitrogenifigens]